MSSVHAGSLEADRKQSGSVRRSSAEASLEAGSSTSHVRDGSLDLGSDESASAAKEQRKKRLSIHNVTKLVEFVSAGRAGGGAAANGGRHEYVGEWVSKNAAHRPSFNTAVLDGGEDNITSNNSSSADFDPMGSKTLLDVYGDIATLEVGRCSSMELGKSSVDSHHGSQEWDGDEEGISPPIPLDLVLFDAVDDVTPERQDGVWLNTCVVDAGFGVRRAVAKRVWSHGEQRLSWQDVRGGIATIESIHHPLIIPLLGWSRSNNKDTSVYLLTDLEPGLSLGCAITKRHVSGQAPLWASRARLCVQVVQDVLDALSYLHDPSLNLVHGSVTVSNIFLAPDMSGARISDCVLNGNFEQQRALTVEHDIRSVGFVVWQLVCGRLIFEGGAGKGDAGFLPKLHAAPDRVVPRKIKHKGMRALFKACVHTEGSRHVAMRTVRELQAVVTDLQRKGLLPVDCAPSGSASVNSLGELLTPKGGSVFGGLLMARLSSLGSETSTSTRAACDTSSRSFFEAFTPRLPGRRDSIPGRKDSIPGRKDSIPGRKDSITGQRAPPSRESSRSSEEARPRELQRPGTHNQLSFSSCESPSSSGGGSSQDLPVKWPPPGSKGESSSMDAGGGNKVFKWGKAFMRWKSAGSSSAMHDQRGSSGGRDDRLRRLSSEGASGESVERLSLSQPAPARPRKLNPPPLTLEG